MPRGGIYHIGCIQRIFLWRKGPIAQCTTLSWDFELVIAVDAAPEHMALAITLVLCQIVVMGTSMKQVPPLVNYIQAQACNPEA